MIAWLVHNNHSSRVSRLLKRTHYSHAHKSYINICITYLVCKDESHTAKRVAISKWLENSNMT